MHEQLCGRIDGGMGGHLDEEMEENAGGQMDRDGVIDERFDIGIGIGWIDDWMGWMDGCMEEWVEG